MIDQSNIREAAADIAKEMGAELLPLNPDRDADQYQRIQTAEGPELYLCFESMKKRICVGINLPPIIGRDGHKQQQSTRELYSVKHDHGSEPETRITCDAARNTCVIARDIRRRLLPGAIIWHNAAVARKVMWEKHAAGTAETVALLAKRLKAEPYQTRVNAGVCELNVSGPDSVRIQHLDVSAEAALAIVAILEADRERTDEA